jgi:hypothetical protein
MDRTKVTIFSQFCKNVKIRAQILIIVKSEDEKLKIFFILFEEEKVLK